MWIFYIILLFYLHCCFYSFRVLWKILLWIISVVLATLISVVFFGAGVILNKINKRLRINRTPLECGFSTRNEARQFTAFRFFIFAVVFIIFDVELLLLFPYLLSLERRFICSRVFRVAVNLLILGLLLEWNNKSFEWLG